MSRASIDVNGTLEYDRGNPAEIAVIEAVLRREYPFVEILIICATLVGLTVTVFGLYGCVITRKGREDCSRGLYRRL